MAQEQSSPKTIDQHVSYAFVLSLKQWELKNMPDFFESKITQQLFISLAIAHAQARPLRLSEFYVDVNASEVGTRKRIVACVKQGYIKIVPSTKDRRAKIIRAEPKFDELLRTYRDAVRQIWLISYQQ